MVWFGHQFCEVSWIEQICILFQLPITNILIIARHWLFQSFCSMEWVGVSWRRRKATPLIWQRMGDNEVGVVLVLLYSLPSSSSASSVVKVIFVLILVFQSVSYSTTAAIVYAVSSVFFFFLVLFLFVVGLTPMTPCFRQCFQLSIIQHLLTLIQANHPQNIMIVRINVIISSCTKCLKKRWVTTPEEKIDWGVKELEDRSHFYNCLLLFHNYVCPHHFLSELLESCVFVATRRKATLHPQLAD